MTINRISDNSYQVYWECQHGQDPAGWCDENNIQYKLHDWWPDHIEEKWPYMSFYIIEIIGGREQAKAFLKEWLNE